MINKTRKNQVIVSEFAPLTRSRRFFVSRKFLKFSRKSQAALEFIMTYGWAILVVLVAIGALAYFGVLSPDKFLPSKCTLQSGIACLDHKATAASLVLSVQNSLGRDITIDRITAQQCTAQGTGVLLSGSVNPPGTMSNGAQATFTFVCVNSGSSKYNGPINITYSIVDTQIQHVNQGQVTTRVE